MEAIEKTTSPFKLPVIGTLREAWQTVLRLRRRLALALLIPFSVAAFVEFFAVYSLGYDSEHYPLLVRCMLGMLLAMAAVTCHRMALLGFESVGKLGVSAADSSLWNYIGRCLLMGLVLFLVVVPIAMLAGSVFSGLNIGDANQTPMQGAFAVALSILLAGLFALVFGQLSLTLPAAAIAKRLGFVDAFELARGNAWRVALLVFGAPFVIEILISILGALVPEFLFVLSQLLLKWLTLPFEIVILSLCYKKLTDAREIPSVVVSSQ